MKLFVFVRDEDFEIFLTVSNLPNSPETFQHFLKSVGTTQLRFDTPKESFIPVPPGSCIRLRTEEDYLYAIETQLPREKKDKSERGSSCVIV
jgi:hypothetical protein